MLPKVLAAVCVIATATPAAVADARRHYTHVGCHTHRCTLDLRYFRHQRAKMSGYERKRLWHLRSCETRGLPYPQNYRYKGAHDGAYQYLDSTWWRAGGRGSPADAMPVEQDVRTHRFIEAGRGGEWACAIY